MKAEEIFIKAMQDSPSTESTSSACIRAMHEYAHQVVKVVLERASKEAYNPTQARHILETEYKDLIK